MPPYDVPLEEMVEEELSEYLFLPSRDCKYVTPGIGTSITRNPTVDTEVFVGLGILGTVRTETSCFSRDQYFAHE